MKAIKVTGLIVLGMVISGCTVGHIKHISKDTFSITTVDANYFNVMLRFTPLADELSKTLQQRVRILCDWDAQSIKVHLADRKDYYHLLYISPVEFCQVNKSVALKALAIRVNRTGACSEVGLIVVPKDSQIRKVADLKGKRFAFGPYGSAYQFYNVLELFKQSQMPTSLLKDVSYCKDSREAAQRVRDGWAADAGVVTESWWKTTTDKVLDFKLLKDGLRIIARTKPAPEYVWACTNSIDEEKQKKILKVLTKTLSDKQKILAGFGAESFKPVKNDLLTAFRQRLDKIKNLPRKPSLLPIH